MAVPSALVDSTCERASGLPSTIQDGSIGDALRSTLQWPVSISASGIGPLKWCMLHVSGQQHEDATLPQPENYGFATTRYPMPPTGLRCSLAAFRCREQERKPRLGKRAFCRWGL